MSALSTTTTASQKAACRARVLVNLKAVTNARLGDEDARSHRIALDLAPQIGHVDSQILLWVTPGARPDRIKQLLVCKRAIGVRHKRTQQVPLCWCQVHVLPGAPHHTL